MEKAISKSTWKLLNEITGRKSKKSELPSYFKKIISTKDFENLEIKLEDDQTIANEFNAYFANVGSSLASKIKLDGDKTVSSGTFTIQFPTADATNAILRIA